ncbi:MAG: PilZ domain-containing protein [Deltaproteobacteria bacterium]|nr:PilZ domain-containing protein [Deltaproteobacteria bacterium]
MASKMTAEQLRAIFRPDQELSLVLDRDQQRTMLDVRESKVYGLEEHRLIIAQTNPPLAWSMVKRELEVTLLISRISEGGYVIKRIGFKSTVLDLPEKLETTRQVALPAICMTLPQSVYPTDLRFNSRYDLPSLLPIEVVQCSQTGVSMPQSPVYRVQNLSEGGMLLSYRMLSPAKAPVMGEVAYYSCSVDKRPPFQFQAQVVRLQPLDRLDLLNFMAIKFLGLDGRPKKHITETIEDINQLEASFVFPDQVKFEL